MTVPSTKLLRNLLHNLPNSSPHIRNTDRNRSYTETQVKIPIYKTSRSPVDSEFYPLKKGIKLRLQGVKAERVPYK